MLSHALLYSFPEKLDTAAPLQGLRRAGWLRQMPPPSPASPPAVSLGLLTFPSDRFLIIPPLSVLTGRLSGVPLKDAVEIAGR